MRSVASLSLALVAVLAALVAAPGPASAAAGGARLDGIERSIVRAINRQRAAHGLGGVRGNRSLARAANFHSRHMLRNDYFSHGAFEQRVRRFARFRTIGETLAYVSRCRGNAGTIVRMWMNSSGHRAILLSGGYRRVGVGKRAGSLGSGRGCVVTADFGG